MFNRDWGNGLAAGLIVGGGLVFLVLVLWYGPICSPEYPCSYPHHKEPPYDTFWYDTAANWLGAITGLFVATFTFATILLVRQTLATDRAALHQAEAQTKIAREVGDAQISAAQLANELTVQAIRATGRPFVVIETLKNNFDQYISNMEPFKWPISITKESLINTSGCAEAAA